ncbi:type VI secretion system lipoprotein TssJ [Acerihabitans arboris]|uniref:Type VI secretion system lipoprotein TssJ n=1 Tax=Acerihabitans arboris TaxID=2691583 RepID=A0A845SN56_9GAMM|nr:type VI secretion system lipoprotein TssJ [Acerihabitans arboris]NDL64386.1 type VI secretion system lipoprotein TssJ [Acerihabitans arboris]
MPSRFPRRRYPFFAGVLALMMFITGCAGGEKPQGGYGRTSSLEFIAHGPLNQGAPLKITVWQLSHKARFLSAGYQELQHDAHTALAGNGLGGEEIFLLPGEASRTLPLVMSPDARYLGLFAEYKNITVQRWRLVLPLPPSPEPPLWTRLWPSSPPGPDRVIIVTADGLQVNNDEK